MRLLQRSICLFLLLAMAAGALLLPANAAQEDYPKIEFMTEPVFLSYDGQAMAMNTPYTADSAYFTAYRDNGSGKEAVIVDLRGNVVYAPKTPCSEIQLLFGTTYSLCRRDGERKYALYCAESGRSTDFAYGEIRAFGRAILAFTDEQTAELYSATLDKQTLRCPAGYVPYQPFTANLYVARQDKTQSGGGREYALLDAQGNRIDAKKFYSFSLDDLHPCGDRYLYCFGKLYSMDGTLLLESEQGSVLLPEFYHGIEVRREYLRTDHIGGDGPSNAHEYYRFTLLSEAGKALCSFEGYDRSAVIAPTLVCVEAEVGRFGVMDCAGKQLVPAAYDEVGAPSSDARMVYEECYNAPVTDYFVAKKDNTLTIFGADGTERAKIEDCKSCALDYNCLTVWKTDETQLLYRPDGTSVTQAPENCYYVPFNGVLFLYDRNDQSYRTADPATGAPRSETRYRAPQTSCAYGMVNVSRLSGDYTEFYLLDAKGREWNETPFAQEVLFNRIGIASYQSKANHCYGALCYIASETDVPDYSFADVARGEWYYDAVQWNVKQKLFQGTSPTQFSPDDSMTRAMLVTVLWRLEQQPAATKKSPFTDIRTDSYYAPALDWAFENGVVNGVSATRFDPNGNVTREQIATILFRYAQKKGLDTQQRADLSAFPDHSAVSAYANDALSWANAAGVVNGTDEGKGVILDPQGDATRAQVAMILMRYVRQVTVQE